MIIKIVVQHCQRCYDSRRKSGDRFKAHAEAIATLLDEQADPEQLTTLAGIEKTVRDQVFSHLRPHRKGARDEGREEERKTSQQLKVKSRTQIRPYLNTKIDLRM